jgi:hypothetical protein
MTFSNIVYLLHYHPKRYNQYDNKKAFFKIYSCMVVKQNNIFDDRRNKNLTNIDYQQEKKDAENKFTNNIYKLTRINFATR